MTNPALADEILEFLLSHEGKVLPLEIAHAVGMPEQEVQDCIVEMDMEKKGWFDMNGIYNGPVVILNKGAKSQISSWLLQGGFRKSAQPS